MRAAVFKAAGQPLSIEMRPDPAPITGEVVMKVARCGVCGSDVERTAAELGAMAYPSGSSRDTNFPARSWRLAPMSIA